MSKISIAVITKNEEENIKDLLESVKWADEIVIVDDFSTDKTLEIAKRYPQVKIFSRKFDDFSKQRQYSFNQAHSDWILMLDADNRVTEDLKKEIIENINHPDSYNGFNVYFQEVFLGKLLKPKKSGGLTRLFKKAKGKIEDIPIHEHIIVENPVGQLKNHLIHYPYRSLSQIMTKFNKYTDLEAKFLYEKGVRTNLLKIAAVPIYTFFHHWVGQENVENGLYGIVLSSLFAIYAFLKHLKIWELQEKNKDD